MKKHICLIGTGGIGTLAAYALERSGQARTTAVLRSNYEIVREKGFDFTSVDYGRVIGWKPWRIVPSIDAATPNKSEHDEYDYIVVAVKSLPATMQMVMTAMKPLVTSRTTIILLQNGLSIEGPVADAFPSTPLGSGVSFIGSRIERGNQIIHDDPDQLQIGAYIHHHENANENENENKNENQTDGNGNGKIDNETGNGTSRTRHQLAKVKEFVDMYAEGLKGIPNTYCRFVPDIQGARWRKLLYNSTYNTLCAVLRISTGELVSSPTGTDTLLRPAMEEIAAVAAKAGYSEYVTEETITEMIENTQRESTFRPSMLVDLEAGRPMELEVILGAPLRIARELGVATPLLDRVYDMLVVIQCGLERESSGQTR